VSQLDDNGESVGRHDDDGKGAGQLDNDEPAQRNAG
jgi:hypothetical protein